MHAYESTLYNMEGNQIHLSLKSWSPNESWKSGSKYIEEKSMPCQKDRKRGGKGPCVYKFHADT